MEQPPAELLICASDAVAEGGRGVRFPVRAFGADATGFVVRYGGQAYAYLNRCAHVPIELDWAEGEFFDTSGLYLMCATHGAIYVPDSGHWVAEQAPAALLDVLTAFLAPYRDGTAAGHGSARLAAPSTSTAAIPIVKPLAWGLSRRRMVSPGGTRITSQRCCTQRGRRL